jgi:hypothetical protein
MTNDAENWATCIWVKERLLNVINAESYNTLILNSYEPSSSVQRATENVFLSGGPTEFFSGKMPVIPKSKDETFREIDKLYGSYDASSREIEIYVKSIERDADGKPGQRRFSLVKSS